MKPLTKNQNQRIPYTVKKALQIKLIIKKGLLTMMMNYHQIEVQRKRIVNMKKVRATILIRKK